VLHSALALLPILLAPPALAGGAPECVSAYGTTACGWDCTAAYGEVRCAQTPRGRCEAAFGEVSCWDPAGPPWRPIDPGFAPGRLPAADCVSAYGETACGWSCTAAYGEVRCARTPYGLCEAAYGEITCWDPPGAGAAASPHSGHGHSRHQSAAVSEAWPPSTCESAYGLTACGWDCTAAYGQVRCARTPQGRCEAAYGEVTCWDPPAGGRNFR